jgi:hypothetical protein
MALVGPIVGAPACLLASEDPTQLKAGVTSAYDPERTKSANDAMQRKADVEINAKGRFSRGGDRSAKVLRVDIAFTPPLDAQRSALGTLALPDHRCGRGVFGSDTYRFCKLISDTIKTAVDIGCGSGAGGMRFYPHESCRALRTAGWVANATRFSVPCGIIRLRAGRFGCRGPRAQLVSRLG